MRVNLEVVIAEAAEIDGVVMLVKETFLSIVWRARCWFAHWQPHHELTPWEPDQIDGYCHCCKRKWFARSACFKIAATCSSPG